MCVCVEETDRQTNRDRERDREKDIDRHINRQTETARLTERDRQTETARERDRQTDRDRKTRMVMRMMTDDHHHHHYNPNSIHNSGVQGRAARSLWRQQRQHCRHQDPQGERSSQDPERLPQGGGADGGDAPPQHRLSAGRLHAPGAHVHAVRVHGAGRPA